MHSTPCLVIRRTIGVLFIIGTNAIAPETLPPANRGAGALKAPAGPDKPSGSAAGDASLIDVGPFNQVP